VPKETRPSKDMERGLFFKYYGKAFAILTGFAGGLALELFHDLSGSEIQDIECGQQQSGCARVDITISFTKTGSSFSSSFREKYRAWV